MPTFKDKCVFCGKTVEVTITDEEYDNFYVKGMLIQQAMPNVSIADREFLLSRICNECFEKHFKDED